MKRLRTYLGLAVVLLVFSGCATQQVSTGTSMESLAKEWQLKEIVTGDSRWLLDDEVAVFTMTIDAQKSRASGQVVCNRWHGPVRLEGERLIIGPAASTRARCRIEEDRYRALEQRYLSGLASSSGYRLENGQLLMQMVRGEIWRFEQP